ncbi:MAG: hypothetical protein LUB59_03915, partial [Candidatus Gastranaerophilales bacterium]|nr:hypothetical protein [Candidatus Gastranaerophilales bacterium]
MSDAAKKIRYEISDFFAACYYECNSIAIVLHSDKGGKSGKAFFPSPFGERSGAGADHLTKKIPLPNRGGLGVGCNHLT